MSAPDDPPPFPPFPVLASERIYDSPWCGLRRDRVRVDDGSLREHHVFEVGPAIVVVPLLPDGRIVMLWQYRHPLGRSHCELPAGRIQPGEPPELAAARELAEETGYRPARLERVQGFFPINGISPHHAHVFRAFDCVPVPGGTAHEATERISVHPLEPERVREKLLAGEIEDGFALVALAHHFLRERG